MNKKPGKKSKVLLNFLTKLGSILIIGIIIGLFLYRIYLGILGIGLLILIIYIWIKISDKIEEAQLEEMIIEDSRYGKIKFVKNQFNYLESSSFAALFGKYKVELKIKDYNEADRELYFRGLDYIYEIQDEIIHNFYDEAKAYCDEWEEYDDNGKPFTYDYIKETFDIISISIENYDGEILITIWGWPADGLLGEHNINAEVNCKTKEISYVLVG